MTTRVITSVLSFLGIPSSSDDNHSIRRVQTDTSQKNRTYPKKEVTNSGSKGVDSANSSTDRGLGMTIPKVNEEGEVLQKPSKRRGTHEAIEAKRDIGNGKRLSYLRDTETSYRKKRKETLKETPVARESVREVTIDVETLKEQLRSSQKELFEANQKASNADRKIQTLEKERDTLAAKLKAAVIDHNGLAKVTERKLAELEGRNRKQEDELRGIQDQLRVSDEKNAQLSKLLEEKTADFKGTQTFLTTADIYSGAEIISMVETLNAEIFQISAFTAELLEDESTLATQEERNANIYQYGDSLEITGQRIGQEFLEHLNNKHMEVRADPLPLQLAVQALLSAQCVREIRPFRSDELGSNLDQLYRRIKTSEVQAVAGRWRAITSATLRDGRDYSTTNMTFEMIVGLLCLCGCSISNQQSRQSISTMQRMLYGLEKLQLKLKTAIKEGITTADFEVSSAAPGDNFGPSWMEDVYADASNDLGNPRAVERRVLTTVGVGLQKRVTKITQRGEPKDQVDVLSKTKVVLLSVLRVFNETQDEVYRPQGK